ncbi:MAG: efflux RND transporter periplasmic adaptor subunit [Candidatus Hatepunaea meridiana]|nr:efflux RND transporter periplasmic adaptor subunit [Candidatus Hatepunaea meridiana]
MKKFILFILAAIIIGLLIYRFAERQKVEKTRTIANIQAEKGYPVEVDKVAVGPFQMIKRFTGTISGGKQSVVVSSLSEHINRVMVEEGQYVEKDQIICELSSDNPLASHNQAKLALANTEKELVRIQQLYDEGAISEQILDGVTLQRNLAAEGLASSEKLLYLRAPFAGKITELEAEVGKLISPGMPVAKIVSNEKARVQVQIPAQDRELIKSGAACEISTDGATISGKVKRISTSADPEDRSFTTWINLSEKTKSYNFSPGLMVDVSINILDLKEAVIVTPDALIREGEKWFIYSVNGNQVMLHNVEIGGQTADAIMIKSGIDPGTIVVTRGANLLYDGAQIRIVTR